MNAPKAILAVLVISCTLAATLAMQQIEQRTTQAHDTAKPEKLLRHVVMFQFKETSSDAEVQKVVDAFGELKNQIPEIYAYEFGTNNSPEGLSDGFTHCFLVTFKSEADRAVYLPHKDHLAFVEILKPHLEKVMVIDYWTGK